MTRRELLAVVFAVVVAGLWMHPLRAQQASRYALTAAIVDSGTVVLDDYEHVLGVDRAVRDGRTYSDKAPGQPFLAVPAYALYRAAGGEPASTLTIDENRGLWWVTLWTSAIPLGLLAVMIKRYLDRHGWDRLAWPVALAVCFSTLLLPFGGLLFGHVLAAFFLFAMLFFVDEDQPSTSRLLLAGFAGGFAVLVEYTAALGVIPILVLAVMLHRKKAAAVVVGAGPPALALLAYNWAAFGGPFSFSYSYSAFGGVPTEARPVTSLFSSPALDNVLQLLFDPRGVLMATPVMVVAAIGLIHLWRDDRRRASVIAAATLAFLLLVVFWGNPWGGDSPGARYLTPVIPLLALPLAMAWARLRVVAIGASVVGSVTMYVAVATDPLVARDGIHGLGTWVRLWASGETAPTVFGSGWPAPLVIGVAGVVIAAMILRRPAMTSISS